MKHEVKKTRQIVGFSLPPDLAGKVKVEAATRKLSLRALFEEMWSLYVNQQGTTRSRNGR